VTEDHPQRIARLTPLDEVHARIDALITSIEPWDRPVAAAEDSTLAEDALATSDSPPTPRAWRDGYAVHSEQTIDASSFAPAPLRPPPARVGVGAPLPAGADAVAPLDAVVARDGCWEAVAPIAPGEGVLPAGAEIAAGSVLRRAGQRLRSVDIAALMTAGRTEVKVRLPRVSVTRQRGGPDPILDAALRLVVSGIEAAGGQVVQGGDADFLVIIGGTGSGRDDDSVRMLARQGEVVAHGIAISPGETTAFGRIRHRPVLLIPGRVDAAFAVWRLLGRRILDRLSGRGEQAPVVKARLTRKVASSLGIAEVVLVRLRGAEAEPIASGYLPLAALVQADGWILIAPESEGYPPGAEVVVRPCA
jgi:molybdopterin molybdotransferase